MGVHQGLFANSAGRRCNCSYRKEKIRPGVAGPKPDKQLQARQSKTDSGID
jgi:hypothetical protein